MQYFQMDITDMNGDEQIYGQATRKLPSNNLYRFLHYKLTQINISIWARIIFVNVISNVYSFLLATYLLRWEFLSMYYNYYVEAFQSSTGWGCSCGADDTSLPAIEVVGFRGLLRHPLRQKSLNSLTWNKQINGLLHGFECRSTLKLYGIPIRRCPNWMRWSRTSERSPESASGWWSGTRSVTA